MDSNILRLLPRIEFILKYILQIKVTKMQFNKKVIFLLLVSLCVCMNRLAYLVIGGQMLQINTKFCCSVLIVTGKKIFVRVLCQRDKTNNVWSAASGRNILFQSPFFLIVIYALQL